MSPLIYVIYYLIYRINIIEEFNEFLCSSYEANIILYIIDYKI
jgi:hypothetical protein